MNRPVLLKFLRLKPSAERAFYFLLLRSWLMPSCWHLIRMFKTQKHITSINAGPWTMSVATEIPKENKEILSFSARDLCYFTKNEIVFWGIKDARLGIRRLDLALQSPFHICINMSFILSLVKFISIHPSKKYFLKNYYALGVTSGIRT